LAPEGEGLQIPPAELFLQFGTVLVNQGKAAEAVTYLEKCVERGPNPAAMYFLGNAHSQLGQADRAEQAWQKAVEIDPASVSAREALGNLAMTKGDLDTALKWLDPLQAVAEKRADTAYLLQRLYALRKDEAAFKHWQERATQLREREQRANALDSMVQGAPYSFWANVVRAHRFAESGNWRQAEDMLDALVSGVPDEQFVVELKEAVRNRTPLPSLDRVPLKRF
jgi:tetratricopeptide (TPR) repeat protein